ncbi:flagellin [Telmatobacter sp. DSM 110680]|uniref:Flagellin n=1 Tax=Telmatobacter sp. DSM 110680 TaxID=3036704 RepID=A0AAU7DFK3_9BACT
MALGVLNNISAIYAQNNLSNTQASLSKTLQQLSSGSRINSGADDAAGLSLANGLQASSTALTQSAKNASEGVDFLQVADGALSQVTSLLNRSITLATEASNGTLNGTQQGAADSEYQKILTEINTIGTNTEYNGINVFNNAANVYTSDGSTTQTYAGAALGAFSAGAIGLGGTVLNVVVGNTAVGTGSGGMDSLGNTIGANDLVMTDGSGSNPTYDLTALGVVGASTGTTAFAFSGTSGAYSARDITGSDIAAASVAGTDYAGNAITAGDAVYTDGAGNMYDLGTTAATTSFTPTGGNAATSLASASGAQAALSLINTAIKTVAADRGTLGANINTLSAVGNVMTMQSTNTLAAENDVTATDYGQATSDMSKFQILSQTGIAALSQANQSQQLITKLLQ